MSSTIITGKRCFAFKARSGTVHYVLFEESYETNVSPQTPRWSATYFGPLAGAIAKIFRIGGAFEGGSLRTRAGGTAIGYIDSWLKLLASPWLFSIDSVAVSCAKGWGHLLGPDDLPSFDAVMRRHSLSDSDQILSRLSEGEDVSFDLVEHADLLADALNEMRIPAWNLLRHVEPHMRMQMPELGYCPKKSKAVPKLEVPRFAKIGRDELLKETETGWITVGWAYSAMSAFIESEDKVEIEAPGAYRQRIAQYRVAVEDAVPVDPNSRFKILFDHAAAEAEGRFYAERVEKIRTKAGISDNVQKFSLDVEHDADFVESVVRLPEGIAKWTLFNEKMQSEAVSNQLDLFA